MSYVVRHKSGKTLMVLADQEVNGDYGVTFTGRRVNSYGEIQQDNFLWLMENFAGEEPINPVEGQTWYDTTAKRLKVYKGNGNSGEWVSLYQNTTVQPTSDEPGNLWFDRDTQQLKVQTDVGWAVVGPSLSSNHLMVEVKPDGRDLDKNKKFETRAGSASTTVSYKLPDDDYHLFRGVGTIRATVIAASKNSPNVYCGMWILEALFFNNGSNGEAGSTPSWLIQSENITSRVSGWAEGEAYATILPNMASDQIYIQLHGQHPTDNTDTILWTVNLDVVMNSVLNNQTED